MQSPVHFTRLRSDLREIYAALQEPSSTGDLPLYATSDGHLYFQKGTAAQIRKIYDNVRCWLQPPSYTASTENSLRWTLTELFNSAVYIVYVGRQKRIRNQVQTINKIWESTLTSRDAIEQHTRYTNHLTKELQGSVGMKYFPDFLKQFNASRTQLLTDKEEADHRCQVVDFHQATYVFWSLLMSQKREDVALKQPVMKWLNASSTLTDRPLFKALKQEGSWIQMEGILKQSIPVALLAKLGHPNSLTVSEKNRLKLWVQALNQNKAHISSKMFYSVLKEIIRIIQMQGSSLLTLEDLLVWLDQQGCELIHQKDPAHMDWRGKLKAGDRIECNGVPLVLGKRLGVDRLVGDRFKVFEIENHPNIVARIPSNPIMLFLYNKQARTMEDHCGVRLVDTVTRLTRDDDEKSMVSDPANGLDKRGRCIVQERLFFSFTDHVWRSEGYKLIQEDEKPALVFANFLFCMSQWEFTPQGLSLSHLMWNREGVLKSTRLLKKGPPNYNVWEDYCVSAAQSAVEGVIKKNAHILSFLMHVSKLSEHTMAVYYRGAVEHTLAKGKTDLIGRPLPLGYRQDIYAKHVKELCGQAEAIRKSCFEAAMELRWNGQYSPKDDAQLEADVVSVLLRLYRASPTPGRFPHNFDKQFLASFSDPSKSIGLSEEAQAYYQEKHQLIMDYNKVMLSKNEASSSSSSRR